MKSVDQIKTPEAFARAVEAMEAITGDLSNEEKAVLAKLARKASFISNERNEAWCGIGDDDTRGYGLCLVLYNL
jgi:hypothetical protein